MFEPEFADKGHWSRQPTSAQLWHSALHRSHVHRVQLLYWREHCLECAVPECYHSCPLYIARQDKRCARFEYGIYPNQSIDGLLHYGAEIKFRKWGKLGTHLYKTGLTPTIHNMAAQIDRVGAAILSTFYRMTNPINPFDVFKIKRPNPQRIGYKIYASLRENILQHLWCLAEYGGSYDMFVMECYSFDDEAFNMILEYKESKIRSRHAIEIKKGHNYREIAVGEFNGTTTPLGGMLNIYPENDKEVKMAFTWLDFVKKQTDTRCDVSDKQLKPVEQVKCVAWDLDNTLWKGILIEDGKNKILVREEAVQLIHALDQRGIIQSVVSKNDYSEAMEALAQVGLKEYFVYSMINWDPKSVNLKRLAAALNINIDSIALIDDSPFERAEVRAVLQQMRVYSEVEVPKLLDYPEFDVPITEESKVRRTSYLAEMEREQTFQGSGSDYEGFLRSCRMEMRIFIPKNKAQIARCLELIQRSNQLNLSTRRYSEADFTELLETKGMLCVGFQCKDRFGDYGIVGFASVDESSSDPRLIDLVISCRVAQKMVERTFIEWLVDRENKKGHRILNAELAKTKRNGPLRSVFESLPFSIIEENETIVRMRLHFERVGKKTDVINTIIDV